MKREISRADIIDIDDYAKNRREHKRHVSEIKRNRRVEVGPFATFYFENFDTMWHQVHEMLHIERGGEAQIKDELDAYNPLIPQGSELVATVMFEIDDPKRRDNVLAQLGGIENRMYLSVAGERIFGRGRSHARKHQPRRQGIGGAVRALPLFAGADRQVPRAVDPSAGGRRPSALRPYRGDARRGAHGARRGFCPLVSQFFREERGHAL